MDETENAATMLDLSRRDLVELSDDLPNAERLQVRVSTTTKRLIQNARWLATTNSAFTSKEIS